MLIFIMWIKKMERDIESMDTLMSKYLCMGSEKEKESNKEDLILNYLKQVIGLKVN